VDDAQNPHPRRHPNKLRLSTPYYLQKKDIDRFLDKFDEYKREKKLA